MLDPTYFLSLFSSYQIFFRYLQAIQNHQGEVILVGKSLSSNIGKWDQEVIHIPRSNELKGTVIISIL